MKNNLKLFTFLLPAGLLRKQSEVSLASSDMGLIVMKAVWGLWLASFDLGLTVMKAVWSLWLASLDVIWLLWKQSEVFDWHLWTWVWLLWKQFEVFGIFGPGSDCYGSSLKSLASLDLYSALCAQPWLCISKMAIKLNCYCNLEIRYKIIWMNHRNVN